jgi:hypothetical protein
LAIFVAATATATLPGVVVETEARVVTGPPPSGTCTGDGNTSV